jgi:hypothetical protein
MWGEENQSTKQENSPRDEAGNPFGIDLEGESQELPPVADVPTTGRIRDRLRAFLEVRVSSPGQVEISAAKLREAIDPALGHGSIMLHKARRARLLAALPAGAVLPGVWIARPEEIEAVAAPLSRIIARRLPEDSGISDLLAMSPDFLDAVAIAQALPEYVRAHKTYETALIASNGQPEGEPNV